MGPDSSGCCGAGRRRHVGSTRHNLCKLLAYRQILVLPHSVHSAGLNDGLVGSNAKENTSLTLDTKTGLMACIGTLKSRGHQT
jgi:hypothetical protein